MLFIPVQLVKYTMHDRCENQRSSDNKNKSRIKGVQTGKELPTGRYRGINRPHPAQKHGGIEECIQPGEVLKITIAKHADTKRSQQKPERD